MASRVLEQVGVTSLTSARSPVSPPSLSCPDLLVPDSLAPVTSATLTVLHTRTILSPAYTRAMETVRGGARIESGEKTAGAGDALDIGRPRRQAQDQDTARGRCYRSIDSRAACIHSRETPRARDAKTREPLAYTLERQRARPPPLSVCLGILALIWCSIMSWL